jgi:hypothetical protein
MITGLFPKRPSAACRCATPSRLAAGPTIFLPEARGVRPHPASARPKSFFNLAFSSSICFSRLASGTSMPPYLAIQLYSVASETPCLRARSAVFAPSHAPAFTPIIHYLHAPSVFRPARNHRRRDTLRARLKLLIARGFDTLWSLPGDNSLGDSRVGLAGIMTTTRYGRMREQRTGGVFKPFPKFGFTLCISN